VIAESRRKILLLEEKREKKKKKRVRTTTATAQTRVEYVMRRHRANPRRAVNTRRTRREV